MPLYILGDTHLSLGVTKPMDVFGGGWVGYTDKLEESLSELNEVDTLILAGDISWGMKLGEALPDFEFLQRCRAKKIIIKGNHDYWWTTVKKMEEFLFENGLNSISFLHNNTYVYENKAVCGTRGWFYEEDKAGTQDEKVFLRELGRLRASLDAGKKTNAEEIICCLHYPPIYEGYRCDPIVDMLREYGVKRCYYGHLHGYSRSRSIEGEYMGIEYILVSSDHVGFKPVNIL